MKKSQLKEISAIYSNILGSDKAHKSHPENIQCILSQLCPSSGNFNYCCKDICSPSRNILNVLQQYIPEKGRNASDNFWMTFIKHFFTIISLG